MSAKKCRKDDHEADEPIFADPELGGVVAWRCTCGLLEEPSRMANEVREMIGRLKASA
jgi:hypothetical protein